MNQISLETWNAVSAVASFAGVIVALVGVILIVRQLKDAKQSQSFEVWREFNNELTSPSNVEARRHCYNKLPPDPKNASAEDWSNVEQIANLFERAGFYISSKFVSEDVILDLYASVIVRTWRALTPYVEYNRRVRRKSSRLWRHFEKLADSADRYLTKNFPNHEVYIYRDEPFMETPISDAELSSKDLNGNNTENTV